MTRMMRVRGWPESMWPASRGSPATSTQDGTAQLPQSFRRNHPGPFMSLERDRTLLNAAKAYLTRTDDYRPEVYPGTSRRRQQISLHQSTIGPVVLRAIVVRRTERFLYLDFGVRQTARYRGSPHPARLEAEQLKVSTLSSTARRSASRNRPWRLLT